MVELIIKCLFNICFIVGIEYDPDITFAEGIYRVFEVNDEIMFADELGEDVPDGLIEIR